MGLFTFIGWLVSSDVRYNCGLYADGRANRKVKVETTIGWRRDPYYKQDGFSQSKSTPSGNVEYSRPVKKKTKE